MGCYTAFRGIILRAFGYLPLKQPEGGKDKTLAGMEWPHRILFEPDLKNQGKDNQPGNHKKNRLPQKPEGEFILCNGMERAPASLKAFLIVDGRP